MLNNFEEIDEEYQKFKYNLLKQFYENNDDSFQAQEKKLIISINNSLKKAQENSVISDENFVRALFGIKTLSKFSDLNLKIFIQFFSIINDKFPKSFSQIRFFIKLIAKINKNQTDLQWNNFNFIQGKILNTDQLNDVESVKYSLISIGFLIQYSPEFVYKCHSEIIFRLIQIIQSEDFILDLNYDIIKYTNQSIDTYFNDSNSSKYYANYAIELFRKILNEKKFLIFDIDQLFEWKSTVKALLMISIIFEKCPKWLLKKNMEKIHNFLVSTDDSNPEIQCLITRNKIFYLINEGKVEPITLLFDFNQEENLICGLIQNIILLLSQKSLFEQSNVDNQKINDLIKFCLDKKSLKNNVFDLINSIILYNKENRTNYFEINSLIIDYLKQNDLYFNSFEVIKFMKEKDEQFLTEKLVLSIKENPIETLQFFNNKYQDENMKNYLSSNDTIIKSVFDLIDNDDFKVKSLSIFVAAQISQNHFFSEPILQKLFHLLSNDSHNKIKISILRCLNNYLVDFSEKNLDEKLLNCNVMNAFNDLLNKHTIHDVQMEAIKTICNLARFKSLKLKKVVKSKLSLFVNQDENNIENILISAEFLPFIFDAFPHYIQKYFEIFYPFSMDLMNSILNCSNDLEKHSKFNIVKLKEEMFLQTVVCSYIKLLEVILKKDPAVIKPHLEEIVNFCYKCLDNEIGQIEAQSILSLLKNVLLEMGLKKVMSNDKIKNINLLFTVVFQTGSRFMCQKIHFEVFQILCFLGAQPLFESSRSLYINPKEKDRLDINLQKELIKFGKYKLQDNIYYIVCSDLMLKILENELMNHLHFQALDTLVDLIRLMPFSDHPRLYLVRHLELIIEYINLMIDKSKDEEKKRFISIILKMLSFNKYLINDKVSDFVQLYFKLLDHGSIEAFPQFTRIFNSKLKPYLNMFIPIIQHYKDISSAINALLNIFLNCFKNHKEQDPSEEQVINILIQFANEGNYQVILLINNYFQKIQFINFCARQITEMCINYIKNNNNDYKNLDDVVKLLGKLMIKCYHLLKS